MNEPLQFIDAHHHLWDLQACHYPWLMARGERRFFGDPTPIQKDYLVSDFLGESTRYRPRASVHIQVGAENALLETAWLHEQGSFPQSVVAFCDLAAADAEQQIEAQLQFPRVRGVRQIVGRHEEEDRKHGSDSLLGNANWLRGLQQLASRGLSFDLQMIPPQANAVYRILKQVPELPVALCHCGSPWDQSLAGLENWRRGLKQLAALPNIYCKVSGLGMFNPDWAEDDLRGPILDVIDIFGPRRIMFGSNFPVDKLYRSYQAYWDSYVAITRGFSDSEKQALFLDTAARFYRIELN